MGGPSTTASPHPAWLPPPPPPFPPAAASYTAAAAAPPPPPPLHATPSSMSAAAAIAVPGRYTPNVFVVSDPTAQNMSPGAQNILHQLRISDPNINGMIQTIEWNLDGHNVTRDGTKLINAQLLLNNCTNLVLLNALKQYYAI